MLIRLEKRCLVSSGALWVEGGMDVDAAGRSETKIIRADAEAHKATRLRLELSAMIPVMPNLYNYHVPHLFSYFWQVRSA